MDPVNASVLRRGRWEEMMEEAEEGVMDYEGGQGARIWGNARRKPPEAGKHQETDSSLESPEGKQPADTLTLPRIRDTLDF